MREENLPMEACASAAAAPNILIVDDSAMMRTMIKRVATVAGTPVGTVFEAANGREAMAILEAQDVHVLFTDINMPVMSGTELLQAMQARPDWRHIVRVIISTDGSDARRHEAEHLNVQFYVEKPFRPEAMRDVLSTLTAATPEP